MDVHVCLCVRACAERAGGSHHAPPEDGAGVDVQAWDQQQPPGAPAMARWHASTWLDAPWDSAAACVEELRWLVGLHPASTAPPDKSMVWSAPATCCHPLWVGRLALPFSACPQPCLLHLRRSSPAPLPRALPRTATTPGSAGGGLIRQPATKPLGAAAAAPHTCCRWLCFLALLVTPQPLSRPHASGGARACSHL